MQVLQELWQAALRGDARAVQQLLLQHGIQADTSHHVSGTSLVMDVVFKQTSSEILDRNLAAVLSILLTAGWKPTAEHIVPGTTVLHVLARQPSYCQVAHRMQCFLYPQVDAETARKMLSRRDCWGARAEEAGTVTSRRQALRGARRQVGLTEVLQ